MHISRSTARLSPRLGAAALLAHRAVARYTEVPAPLCRSWFSREKEGEEISDKRQKVIAIHLPIDPGPTMAGRVSGLLGGSYLLSAVVAAGLAGCQAHSVPEKKVLPPVVVTESRKMTLPIIVKPIGTTRALKDVTIRARVEGF